MAPALVATPFFENTSCTALPPRGGSPCLGRPGAAAGLATPIKALLLAAGRGERMRPLTDNCPKPLLPVQGKPLMQWSMEALAGAGVTGLVVNTAWLGQQIAERFGPVFRSPTVSSQPAQGPQAGLPISYSHEELDFGAALETAGGIARALPLLCAGDASDMFWVLAGDVFAPDFQFSPAAVARFAASDKLAHLWLVPNPTHHPRGDFGLSEPPGDGHAMGLALNLAPDDARPRYTYSTFGLYRRQLFAPPWCDIPAGNPQGIKAPLAPLLRAAMDRGQISAELYVGAWADVGTPARLQELNQAHAGD